MTMIYVDGGGTPPAIVDEEEISPPKITDQQEVPYGA
jgi:hypothetical protein